MAHGGLTSRLVPKPADTPPSPVSSSHPSLPLHAPFYFPLTSVILLCDSPLIPPHFPRLLTHSLSQSAPPPFPSSLLLYLPPPKPAPCLSPAVAVATVCSAHQAPAVPKLTGNSLITHPFIPLSVRTSALRLLLPPLSHSSSFSEANSVSLLSSFAFSCLLLPNRSEY